MTERTPPRWLERILSLFVPERDREAISGDLLEEYREERLPRFGSLRANVWYLRQCISFVSIRIWGGPKVKQAALALCVFVMAACAWLAVMENVLKHGGYTERSVVDLCIAAQAVAALFCVLLDGRVLFRFIVLSCAVAVAIFGAMAVLRVLHAQHFEGFVLVIGVGLILQGAFTSAALLRVHNGKAA